MSGPAKPSSRLICDLPCDLINRTLGTDLESGKVLLSRAAQKHASKRHPTDYPLCLPHLATVISSPLYIGDDYKNAGIELITRVAALGEFVLVAVNLEADESGHYHIASFYIISEKRIQGRREKGFLRVAVKETVKA